MIKDFKRFKSSNCIHDDETLDQALLEYCDHRFAGLIELLDQTEREQFLDELVLPIFAHHRFKKDKGFAFLQRFPNESFEIVTKVCESYSTDNMKDYMNVPTLAFLMVWFSKNEEC